MVFALSGCSKKEEASNLQSEKKTVKLAYVNWAEGIAMTNLAAAILEEKMGYTVERTMADVAPVFTSVASGNTDAFLDVWLPVTHEEYMKKYGEDLVDLGTVYENAMLGLVVPSYVDIDSIEQLNENKELFGGEIVGIDAGAGLMEATQKAMEAYELDYHLLTGSGTTMTAALSKAIDVGNPIVVTGWAPHWKFARWDLKVLEDSKKIFGDVENIHIVTRKGLEEDLPEVVAFLKNFKLTDEELGDLMGVIEDDGGEPFEIAKAWMKDHDELIQSFLPSK
ncbi:glycine betaine ABC transporter substrate-binding protein [Candidatus Galacturonibacter soehngenii]|uniref:Glycine betaine ABC transporter substrate-binding protein n=2 Tax=Candidatus Galacturonatibacter soehngenii TaxID=2307010 RepID=A0A7V7UDG8_9FIRM|nr:glycine betaine ABC transporter substrate-binding protein [Candidatus Galacturonibacter soehngenii]